MCLRSWVLQSVPPAIVLHLWGALFCMLVVLQLARPVWGDAYLNPVILHLWGACFAFVECVSLHAGRFAVGLACLGRCVR